MMEQIVYVDKTGKPTGEVDEKLAAHHANTRLHLAFSCYIFNDRNELLVTQRAHGKKVWPGVWTNSVCGHPAPGEVIEDAIRRRASFELGLQLTDIQVILPQYSYTTPPFKGIIENEFCPVFVARCDRLVQPNANEVAAFEWMKWENFVSAARSDTSDGWSWWCKDQLNHLETNQMLKEYLLS